MMSDAIRIRRSFDAETILRLARENDPTGFTHWNIFEHLQMYLDSERYLGFVAFDSDSPVGAILLEPEEEGRLWINLLIVSMGHRRRSIASRLIQRAVAYGINAGHRVLFVDLDYDNTGGLQFYLANGFSLAGVVKGYYANGLNAIFLFRELQ